MYGLGGGGGGVLSCRAANSNLKGVKVTSRKPRPSIADIGAFRRLMVSRCAEVRLRIYRLREANNSRGHFSQLKASQKKYLSLHEPVISYCLHAVFRQHIVTTALTSASELK